MPSPGGGEDMGLSAPRTELEQLQSRCKNVTEDSLDSTRRMVILCDESKEAGIRTLVALDDQGEQLDRVEEDMDRINADMKEAEKALTGMEQCCGLCRCPCVKSKSFKDEATWTEGGDGKIIGGQPTRVTDERNSRGPITGRYIATITKDALEEEMEDNMQQVNTMIGNLRNMALDMGQEIGSQNQQIETINEKAESNKNRIQGANERAQKLLK